MPIRALVAASLALLLAACATDKPIETGCPRLAEFTYPRADRTLVSTSTAVTDADDFSGALDTAFAAPSGVQARVGAPPRYADALILSGGGEWGAYGAGVIRGWSARGRLPARLVTGISTGALQATFAYLGPTQDEALIGAYAITDERELVRRHGATFFLSHASMADTAPLKRTIERRLGGTLDAVRAEYRATGRQLLVGAVDGLSGRFHVFDLTRMADALDGAERLNCYTAALMASAAVPVVFRQATINGKPWLDGGVRHSMFLPAMVRAVAVRKRQARLLGRVPEGDGTVYALRNGTLAPEAVDALPAKLLPTVQRLIGISVNQIEQDSLDLAAFYARYAGQRLLYTTADGWESVGAAGCDGARPGRDSRIFDPVFMRCLIAVGEARWANGGTPWREAPSPSARLR